jgi:probable DNA metabolism protein
MGGIYRYDGSFAGLLTLLGEIVPGGITPDAIDVDLPAQGDLFTTVTTVATDEELAEKFWMELSSRLTPACRHQVRTVFLADHPQREMIICRFLLLGWEVGKNIGNLLAHPHVEPLWKLSQQVGREAHRYLGFVRFQEVTGGFYYGAIAPDHRVLPLIARHFVDRFGDQQWVIHDVRHGEGIVYDRYRSQWLTLPMEAHDQPELTPSEERFQELWRRYFATLAIAERQNLQLQQSKVPLKVRPWLVEFCT